MHGACTRGRYTLGRGGGGRSVLRLSSEEEAEFDCNKWETGELELPRMMSLSLLKSRMEKCLENWLPESPWFKLLSLKDDTKLFSNSKSCCESLVSKSLAEFVRASKVMDERRFPFEQLCWDLGSVSAFPNLSASLTLAWRVCLTCFSLSKRLTKPAFLLLSTGGRCWWDLPSFGQPDGE